MHLPADLCCHRCGQSPAVPDAQHCPTCGLRLIEREQHERYPRDPFLGSQLGGKYALLGRLGEGGMGAVYRSWHPDLGLELAVKVIRYDTQFQHEEARERFRREARVLAGLAHHAVVRFYDFGVEEDGTLFLALEYVEGHTLQHYFEQGGLKVGELVSIGRVVADALAEAARQGIGQRDLKPYNIMGRPATPGSGKPWPVKVLDFGLVKLREQAEQRRLTGTGLIPGTPRYMSPEQCAGQPVDHRSDIYTLCTVLYEGLAGRLPFEGAAPLVVFSRKASEDPPPLPEDRGLPAQLEAVVHKGLARLPADRYQSASELAVALAELQLGGAAGASLPAVRRGRAEPGAPGEGEPRTITPTLPGVKQVPAARAPKPPPAQPDGDDPEGRAATFLIDEARAATILADEDRAATRLIDDAPPDPLPSKASDPAEERLPGPSLAATGGADLEGARLQPDRQPTTELPAAVAPDVTDSRRPTAFNERIPTAPPVGPAPVQPFLTYIDDDDPLADEFEPAGQPWGAGTWALLVLGGLAVAALLVGLYLRADAPPEDTVPVRRDPGADVGSADARAAPSQQAVAPGTTGVQTGPSEPERTDSGAHAGVDAAAALAAPPTTPVVEPGPSPGPADAPDMPASVGADPPAVPPGPGADPQAKPAPEPSPAAPERPGSGRPGGPAVGDIPEL